MQAEDTARKVLALAILLGIVALIIHGCETEPSRDLDKAPPAWSFDNRTLNQQAVTSLARPDACGARQQHDLCDHAGMMKSGSSPVVVSMRLLT